MILLWCDGDHDAVENMRRDRVLLEAYSIPDGTEWAGPPAASAGPLPAAPAASGLGALPSAVLRLFRFRPPGITLGHGQDPERELDLERCRRDGVAWAKRPTGGRAIFHDAEWTYSLATRIGDREWGGSLSEAYGRVTALLLASLNRLGVPAVAADASPRPVRAGVAPRDLRPACFAATARHEITLAGRKLVGSAQRRTAHGLLQQGSVLLGPSHLRLADYLRLAEASRAALRAELDRAATDAGRYVGAQAPLERWADALLAELGPRASRVSAAAVEKLLTLDRRGSYTPSAS